MTALVYASSAIESLPYCVAVASVLTPGGGGMSRHLFAVLSILFRVLKTIQE